MLFSVEFGITVKTCLKGRPFMRKVQTIGVLAFYEGTVAARMRSQICAVGRRVISFTSISAGCSIAKAIARAIASGGIANLSRDSASLDFTSGFVTESVKFVRTKPGEMIVTRSLSPASWRKPSEIARTANFVPE